MFLIMALNGMLFVRFQKVQEKLADLVEDRDNEMLFSKKRQEFRSAISSSSNSQIGSPKNQQPKGFNILMEESNTPVK